MLVSLAAAGCDDRECTWSRDDCSKGATETFALGDRAALEGAPIEVCVDARCHKSTLRFFRATVDAGGVCDQQPAFACHVASTAENADALRIDFVLPAERDGSYAVTVTIRTFDPRAPTVVLSERSIPIGYRVGSDTVTSCACPW